MSEAGMWSRINRYADCERMTLEQLAELSDHELLRQPNFGVKSLRLFRAYYPRPRPTLPPISDRGQLIQTLAQARDMIGLAIKLLEADGE